MLTLLGSARDGHSAILVLGTKIDPCALRLSYFRGAKPMEPGRSLALDEETLVWEPNGTVISQENGMFAHQGFLGEMRNLAGTLLDGKRVQPDIDEGIASLAFAEAVLKSDGQLVRLDN